MIVLALHSLWKNLLLANNFYLREKILQHTASEWNWSINYEIPCKLNSHIKIAIKLLHITVLLLYPGVIRNY